jgi:hypothetical protein
MMPPMKCGDLSKLEGEIILFEEMNGLFHSFVKLSSTISTCERVSAQYLVV